MTAPATPPAPQSVIAAFQTLVADKTPYVWGGMSQLGADCSGAVKWAFAQAGFTFGARTAADQASLGADVPLAGTDGLANAVAGDVLFFDDEGPNTHEALYAGNDMDYEESTPGQVAHLIPVDSAHLDEIRQFVGTNGAPLAGITADGTTGTSTTATAMTTTAATATDTSVLSALDPANWESTGAKLLFVAGGLGLIIFGATKTANPA